MIRVLVAREHIHTPMGWPVGAAPQYLRQGLGGYAEPEPVGQRSFYHRRLSLDRALKHLQHPQFEIPAADECEVALEVISVEPHYVEAVIAEVAKELGRH